MLRLAPSTRVLIAGICALILSLGMARFAFTPMIPFMAEQAGLTEDVAGWLAGLNYVGYLLGTLIVARTSSLVRKDTLYRGGLWVAVLTTLMMAITSSVWVWAASRFFAGLATAAGLLAGSGLVMQWRIALGQRPELGMHFSGSGAGIVLGAAMVALTAGYASWSGQWVWLSALGACCLVPALAWLPRATALPPPRTTSSAAAAAAPSRRWMNLLKVAYALSGFGYVVSATFLVAHIESQPALQGQGVLAWLLVGLASTPAPVIWDRVARARGYLWTLKLNFWLLAGCICLPVLSGGLWAALAGALIYGLTFIGIVSLMLTLVGRLFPTRAGEVMAELTLGFCIAQIVGPVVAGELAVITGTFEGSLLATAVIMLVGAGCLQAMGSERSATP